MFQVILPVPDSIQLLSAREADGPFVVPLVVQKTRSFALWIVPPVPLTVKRRKLVWVSVVPWSAWRFVEVPKFVVGEACSTRASAEVMKLKVVPVPAVAVGVSVGVFVTAGILVEVGVRVGVTVVAAVGVREGVAVGVLIGVGVRVGVPVIAGVGLGVDVGPALAEVWITN